MVDCIHTTNDLLTTNSATCDIDFYVNPGCSCSSGIIPVNSGMMFAVILNSDTFLSIMVAFILTILEKPLLHNVDRKTKDFTTFLKYISKMVS